MILVARSPFTPTTLILAQLAPYHPRIRSDTNYNANIDHLRPVRSAAFDHRSMKRGACGVVCCNIALSSEYVFWSGSHGGRVWKIPAGPIGTQRPSKGLRRTQRPYLVSHLLARRSSSLIFGSISRRVFNNILPRSPTRIQFEMASACRGHSLSCCTSPCELDQLYGGMWKGRSDQPERRVYELRNSAKMRSAPVGANKLTVPIMNKYRVGLHSDSNEYGRIY